MNFKALLTFTMICLAMSMAMASTQDELVEHIKVRCSFNNSRIPLDERLGCMTDYINCAVTGPDEIDLKRADDKCLKTKEKQREQFQN